ncbi:MAG: hypothetical protein KGJ89_00485 [Patescibacteria group bacterium]|nr:hypothetical protein [Patescibacteria group bacterium]MDE2014997.1 hypothetical protein [Patescibacteria group bacterium]MDE2226426.1 hypothetical protein [Patescibacteria group bacterium]
MNKTILLVIIIVVAAVAVVYLQWKPAAPVSAPVTETSATQQSQQSSDPDAIANNILSDTNQLAATPSESDPSLVAPSTDVSNSFDQSLSPSQF